MRMFLRSLPHCLAILLIPAGGIAELFLYRGQLIGPGIAAAGCALLIVVTLVTGQFYLSGSFDNYDTEGWREYTREDHPDGFWLMVFVEVIFFSLALYVFIKRFKT